MPSTNPTTITTTTTSTSSINPNIVVSNGNLESSMIIKENPNHDDNDTQQQQEEEQSSLTMNTTTTIPILELKTVDFDARFPNTNQTKHCWQKYVDYQKCIKVLGEGHSDCQSFQRDYRSLCPYEWVSLNHVERSLF